MLLLAAVKDKTTETNDIYNWGRISTALLELLHLTRTPSTHKLYVNFAKGVEVSKSQISDEEEDGTVKQGISGKVSQTACMLYL